MVELPDEIVERQGYWIPKAESLEHSLRHAEDARHALPHCERKRIAVQAGGFIGLWPLYLARRFDLVMTFEPSAINLECMSRNLRNLDRLDGEVIVTRAALGKERGVTGYECPEGPNGFQTSRTQVCSGTDVNVVSIDDIGLDHLDLLCLDVESYELEVLKGAYDTIQRHHPVIMLEATRPRARDGRADTYADIANLLHGYEERHRLKSDVVLVWTGTSKTLPYRGKPTPRPTQPPYRGKK